MQFPPAKEANVPSPSKLHLEMRAHVTSRMLQPGLDVEVSARNGKTALDLRDEHGIVRNLTVGTKREVYSYLDAMIQALEIVGRVAV